MQLLNRRCLLADCGAAYRFYGLIHRRDQSAGVRPPTSLTIIPPRSSASRFPAGVCDFAPRFRCRKSRRYIRATPDFVDRLAVTLPISESEFESLTYHHVVSSAQRIVGAPVVITLGSVYSLAACGVAAPGSRVPIRFPAGYLYIPAARCDERARRSNARLPSRYELQRICDTACNIIIINPPRMSWRRLFAFTLFAVKRSWNSPQRRNTVSVI